MSEKTVDFKKNLRIYLNFAKPYKTLFALAFIAVAIVAFARVAERYMFKILIDAGTEYGSGVITATEFTQTIWLLTIAFILLSITNIASDWLKIQFINLLETNMILDLKKAFFDHIIELSHNFHTSNRTGSLITRLLRGGRAIEGITDFFVFETIPLIIEFLMIFIIILTMDVASAIIIGLMAITYIGYSVFVLQRQQSASLLFIDAEDVEKAHVSDAMMNIETIKYFGKESQVQKIFSSLAKKTKKKQLHLWSYSKWMISGHGVILVVSLVAMLYFPIMKVLGGELSIGSIAFIYTVYLSLVGPLGRFAHHLRHFYLSVADFQSLTQYGDLENEIKDKKGAKNLKITKGSIEFVDVDFKYQKRKVLKSLSLKINPNEKIALIGHSGSGKTTLAKILYRLYNLDKGLILIDGQDIKDVKQDSLRKGLSIVPQEGILFNDTIYNNLTFSKPSAKKEEVIKAMKAAQFYDFVSTLPDKEKTMVGERGIKLSGGEKQRLSIARAILANKKILILDEATSALDSKTESQIQKALARLMKGRTSIIIAHRLSTIMHADKIVVMNKGRIVQLGKHKDLIKKKGIYKELWDLQEGGYLKE